jgi:hypothetical protein
MKTGIEAGDRHESKKSSYVTRRCLIPQTEMFGLAIVEPMTEVTDYAIAVVCGWFAARLFSRQQNCYEIVTRS